MPGSTKDLDGLLKGPWSRPEPLKLPLTPLLASQSNCYKYRQNHYKEMQNGKDMTEKRHRTHTDEKKANHHRERLRHTFSEYINSNI